MALPGDPGLPGGISERTISRCRPGRPSAYNRFLIQDRGRIAAAARRAQRFVCDDLQLSEYIDAHPEGTDNLLADIDATPLCRHPHVQQCGAGFRCVRCGMVLDAAEMEDRAMNEINDGGPDNPGQFDTDAGRSEN